jgi:hypothetical protein
MALAIIILIVAYIIGKIRTRKIIVDNILIHDGLMELIYKIKLPAFVPDPNRFNNKIEVSLENIELFKKRKVVNTSYIIVQILIIFILIPLTYRSLGNWIKSGPALGPSPEAIGNFLGPLIIPIIFAFVCFSFLRRIALFSDYRSLKLKLKRKYKRYHIIDVWLKSEDAIDALIEIVNKDNKADLIFDLSSVKEENNLNQGTF